MGAGESIWLGWFLHASLTRFAGLCLQQASGPRKRYLQRAKHLAQALDKKRLGWKLVPARFLR